MSVRLSLKESNTVVRKVTGRFEGEFDITIRQPTAAERMEIRGLATAENYGEIRKLRHSFVVGWSGLLDDDGNEIPFNVRTHEMVLRIQPIQDGIYQTVINYFEESESILTDDVKKKSNGPLESIATVDPPTL